MFLNDILKSWLWDLTIAHLLRVSAFYLCVQEANVNEDAHVYIYIYILYIQSDQSLFLVILIYKLFNIHAQIQLWIIWMNTICILALSILQHGFWWTLM